MPGDERVRITVEDLSVSAAATAIVVLHARLDGQGEVVLGVALSDRPSLTEVSRRLESALPTEERLQAALVDAGVELTATRSGVEIGFDRERFTPDRLAEVGEQLAIVAAALRATPDEPFDRCPLLTAHARTVLPDPTATLDAPVQEPIERALARLASSAKDAAAMEHCGAVWSFGDLDARAAALASALRERGVVPGDRVIVTGPRCPAVVAAIVAVWKCGAVIVPISESLPEQRREVMAHEAKAVFAIVASGDGNDPSLPTLRVSEIDASIVRASGRRSSESVPSAGPDAAYVFFTSGTTGTPKGIVGTHQGLAHFVTWQRRRFEIGPGDRAAQLTGLSFDVVMRDMFTPLSAGATLCFPEREAASMDPDLLLAWLRDRRITLMHSVPSVLESWLTSWRGAPSVSSLRLLFMAGEPLTDVLVRRIRETFSHARVVNLYGPTETTLAKCFHEVSTDPEAGIQPVGHAIAGAQAFVLNASGTRCGVGEPGEIVIRTPFRTLGYLGGEARGGKFRPNPFRDDEADLVYFTGDRGRHRQDGALEILGRVDDQVKIHGVRVEPAEVSAALRTHPDVVSCFVGAITEPGRPTSLCAWVVLDAAARRDSDVLRRHLADRLVAAMVPATFVFLEKLPLSPNGKVDRKALPPPTPNDARPHVAPRSATEETLAEIWRTVLGVERIGIDESFFELGGHSLSATQVAAQVRRKLNVELPMRALFDHPTIRQIAERIAELAPAATEPTLARVRRDAPLPLSSSESRLWFLDQLEPGRATYNLHRVVRIRGALDEPALERALTDLVARHEPLRTRYEARAGEPTRVIDPAPASFPLERIAITDASDASAAIAREARRPFDLAKGPLFRAALFGIGRDEHVLALSMHHIVSDGWSLEIIERELAQLYAAHRDGLACALPDLPIQYADHAAWQREWMATDAMRKELFYWTERLRGAPDTLDLPTDRARPARRREQGATIRVRLRDEVAAKVAELARHEECAPFMVLFAAFNVLLHRLTRQDDLVVGVPIANRARPELGASWGEGVVGFLVNTLAMRTRLAPKATFREVLTTVKNSALDAYEHQDVPFELLVDALRIARDPSRTPLFQVMFAHETEPLLPSKAWGTSAAIELPDLGIAKFDLRLQTEQLTDGLAVSLEYDSDLFDAETAVRLVSRYAVLLDSALRAPDERIGGLDLLTEEERRQVVVDFNATRWELPTRRVVHEIFEEQVARTPDAIAVELGDASLTYRELDDRADALAEELRARGARGRVVAVVMERSLEMVIALYAALKAGAAYAPLDPSHPRERLQFMVDDLDAPIILSTGGAASAFAESPRLVRVDAKSSAKPRARSTRARVDDADLAYLIYTSGSTGKPKGVMNTHEGLRNRLLWMQAAYGLGAGDAVLQKTPYTFDVSVWEFFWPLLFGARLVVARPEGHRDPHYLAGVIRAARITTIHFVPSMLEAFLESADVAQCKTLKRVVCSGEALPAKLVDRFHERLPWCELHNLYGPTEASIDVTFWECRPGDRRDDIPIGAPISNTQMYVVDSEGAPAPIGVPGELCIAGIGLARGYWRRPDLTADRFVPNPFATEPGARMYRTGDLARWSRDGHLQYLGRLDHQVKLRGLRIELGEIEHALLAQPGVRAAVVVAREDRPGDKRLVAYVTAAADGRPVPEELRRALARALPEYMVPAAIVAMDALPLSANGKVDRKALPAPEAPARTNDDDPPRGPREERIAQTFAEILGVARIGRNEDFFDLGGHSLLATRLVAHLRERLQVELPLRAIFEARTVAALAEHVGAAPRSDGARIDASSEEARSELSFAEARLWFLDQYESGTSLYNVTRMLRLRGALDETALASALRDVADRHESLRTRFTSTGGAPRRVIDPPGSPPLVERRAAETEPMFRALLHEELHRGFDLERGPLFRATLVRRSTGEHVLLLAMHHVVTDGWSMDVLVRELSFAYEARRNAQKPLFEPLAIQYADYAAWQRAWLASGTLERQLAYWKAQLGDAPASLDLPTDRPRPLVKSPRGATLRFDLASDVARGVRALAQAEGATAFMVLLAAFDVLLARHAGIEDVVVGTPVAGRGRPEVEGVVGFFVNTLVIRTKLDGRPSFREIVRRAKRATLGAFDHQDVPFERLAFELNPPRDTSRTPVIQVVFAFETSGHHDVIGPGLELARIPVDSTTSKFDLTLTIAERDGALSGALEYDAELFDPETVHAIAERYGVLLGAAVSAPDRRAVDLPITSAAERQRLLATWNATARDYPRDATIDALFAARAAQSPEAVALVFGDRAMSYRELDEASSRIATGLFAAGVRTGARVGISSDRSFEQIAGLLGILKAGAAYVPLDPSYPADRLALLTREARVETALDPDGRLRLPASVRVLRNADLLARAPAERPREAPAHGARHGAYVLFTSGSTGTPKGVVVEHRAVVRLTKNVTWAKFGEDDVFVALAPLAFDASTLEIWAPLLNGARLVVPPPGVLDLDEVASLLRTHSVTFAWMTAGLFHQMVDHAIDGLRGVRQLFAGGDVLSPSHVRKVLAELPGVRLVNGYGPTENTTFTTTHAVSELAVGRAVPIGRPITNTTVYVLDSDGEPAPIGVFGELYTGGDGVARGYLGARETASRFVPDPFGGPGARMYRTGDIARWRHDGVLEFAGRRDGQVKLRGFRIEVGEIEAALAAVPGVKQTAVVLREDRPGDKRLAAYVVGDAPATLDVETLRAAARRALPEYMVPSAFVVMDALPLNANGKIDRKALPAPDFATEEQYVAPRTPAEETIAAAFSDVLGAPRVGVHDDFFALGGHSLLATRLAARLKAALNVEVPVRAVFERSTVAKLAERLGGVRPTVAESTIPRVARGGPLAASYAQERLWFLEQLDPGQATYNVPLLLRLRGAIDEGALEQTVSWLVARHESLRTTFAEIEGRPSQVIHETMRVPLERDVGLQEITSRGFDLANGPLVRAALSMVGPNEYVFALVLHHVVTDGASMSVLERELGIVYSSLARGESPPLDAMTIQYADYAAWQRRWLASGVLDAQLSYWKEALSGAPATLQLLTDRPRPPTKQHRGSQVSFEIGAEIAARVATIARQERATTFMVLLAAFDVVLARHTGQDDLVVGTPIAGRARPELDGVTGFFVNTLALRVRLDRGPTFRELVQRVKKVALDAYEHQDVPFEKIVEAINPIRDPSRTPIFQAMFAFESNDAVRVSIPELTVERERSFDPEVSKFDLTVGMTADGDRLRGEVEYDTALFDRTTIARFAEHFITLLDNATRLPEQRVATLSLMNEAELATVRGFATHGTLPEAPPLLHGLFERTVAAHPDATAVRDADGNAMTFAELDAAARALAIELRALGVRREVRVAVISERSLALPVAMLAVMKAGGVYVPIDVDLPASRRDFMLTDSDARIAVVDRPDRSVPSGVRVVVADPQKRAIASTRETPRESANLDAAVVLFTSGSTGVPKGVVLEHRSLAPYMTAFATHARLDRETVTVAFASIGSDASIEELFATWASGGSVLLRSDVMLDPLILADACERWGVTYLSLPTAYWAELWDAIDRAGRAWPATLRVIAIGGEKAHPERVARWNEHPLARPLLLNGYGPTETTELVTWCDTSLLDRGARRHEVNIGRPTPHCRLYVVDDDLELVPVGVPGELCVGGIAVGRGYLGRPGQTAAAFVPDPFTSERGARMYRTGDLVRWRPDGTVEFLGRADDQVKIRGFRIEPGEVESALAKLPGVREAAVVARLLAEQLTLIAYVVSEGDIAPRLRKELAQSLPEYMVPSVFVTLDAMPTNANGKIDRRRLPDPPRGAARESSYVGPRSEIERRLCDIFAAALSTPRVGVHDDFFELGGHSLLATRVVSRIRSDLAVGLSVRTLFDAPTVARLAERISSSEAAKEQAPLARVDRRAPSPASFAQARLWFLDQLEGGGGATYNVPTILRLSGPIDASVLERAVQELVNRHEGLRTTFVAIDGAPHQVVHPGMVARLARVEVTSEDEARFVATREAHAPFDLANGPLFRAMLVRIREDAHLFLLCIHHIVTDGWSMGVLERELSAVYAAFADAKPSPLPAPSVDYLDFTAWQRAQLTEEALAPQLAFWKDHLDGAPASLELPTDRPRPAIKQYAGASVPLVVPRAVAESVRVLCRREAVTPFMVLLAAYQCVLSRWSKQRDVVVGTVIANRTRRELEGIVGFFANTLAMRATFEPETSFLELLGRVKQAALSAFAHQDVPFEKLVEALRIPRDTSRTPVFQASFVLQNDETVRLAIPGVRVDVDETVGLDVAKFDIALALTEDGERLRGDVVYDVALFDRPTIERFAEHFVTLVDAATRMPSEPVAKLPMMSDAEKQRILVDWNGSQASYHRERRLDDLIIDQALASPDAVALVDEARTLTYRDLADESAKVASALVARGVARGDIVALHLARGVNAVIAMIGVMRAGAAYLPVDTEQPAERIRYMLADSRARLTIADRAQDRALEGHAAVAFEALCSEGRAELPRRPGNAADLAYVIYTSGSTGRPKGAGIAHATIAWLAQQQRDASIWPQRRSQFASLSFDAHVWEVWPTLISGGSLHVVPERLRADPSNLIEWFARERIDWAFVPTALAELCLRSPWPTCKLTRLTVGGDRLHEVPDASYPFELENVYGPTECTCVTTTAVIPRGDRHPGIGRPIAGARTYVLDERLDPVPIGHPGELYVGGALVGRGYLGRPLLSAEKFIPDPFSSEPGARMYRSGDLVRWRADGTIDYLGRRDHQVKVRGFRIELGEIEAALRAVAGVSDGVVVAHDDPRGGKQLVAYVVGHIGVESLDREIRRVLPDYMVPRVFVVLGALPLNASGKVDRSALPAPDFALTSAEYVAPRDALEETLAGIFAEVLALPRVGVHDDFFALGGHSLLATRVVSRIRSATELELSVRTLFDAPTIARLAERARERSGASSSHARLVRVDRSVPLPASFAQARLWFLDQLEGGASATYNVPTVLRLAGPLDASILERAVQEIVRRHDGLRTTFAAIDGVPHQVVHPTIEVELARIDAGSEDEARAAAAREARTPFDLARGPLVRATLVRVRDDAHFFILCIHHIVTDGWSMGVLERELSVLYAALREGRPAPLAPQSLDYPDFSAWQRATLTSQALAPQLAFWREHLAGAPAALELPTDRPRPATKRYAGASVSFVVPSAVTESVRALCRRETVTPFMVLLAAYQCVLSRWSGQRDVVVGTPIANRTRQELEGIVGFFVNTLAMRSTIERDTSFLDLLLQVKGVALAAHAHQDIPFEKLVEELGVPRDPSRTPVFQALFVVQNNKSERIAFHDVDVEYDDDIAFDVAKFDLTLAIAETGDELRGRLEFDAALFDAQTIERFAGHFVTLLGAATRCPQERVKMLPLMSDAERALVVEKWSSSNLPYARTATVDALFAVQVARAPDDIALVFGERRMSYRELDEASTRIAHALGASGMARGARIAISSERSLETVVGVLGILKAGGAYVPIDPGLPAERAELLAREARVDLALDRAGKLRLPGIRTLDDDAVVALSLGRATVLPASHGSEDAAYILFTSGSTGVPKAVVVPHRAIVRLVNDVDWASFTSSDVFLALAPLAFDASTLEIWAALTNGARLVVAPPGPLGFTEIDALLDEHGVTFLWLTAGLFHEIVEHAIDALRGLRQLFAGGDVLSPPHVARVIERFPKLRLVNGYGPTENTTFSTCHPIESVTPGEAIPIGRPIARSTCYVLDDDGDPVPVGVFGELHCGGDGVAHGYLAAAATAERFVPDPFARQPGRRMYRTGDIVRWRSDGALEFAGRRDGQVKIRGFRIELGELESVLAEVPSIRAAAVAVRGAGAGDKRLVAYVVWRDGVAIDETRALLRKRLPEYMMPSAFVALDALPLTESGKVDRKALPEPDFRAAAAEYVAPRTPTEQAIADVFAQVLGADRVGVHDDFFALGGHSLLVAKLVAAVHNRLDVAVPLATFFKQPTVEHLAAAVDAGRGVTGTLLQLREGDQRAAIVLVAPVGGKLAGYLELIAGLGDVHVLGLRARGLAPGELPLESVEEMAAEHVTALRASHPGPYVLAGWSFGGVLAFEIARRLAAEGATIADVVLIDAYLDVSDDLPTDETALLLDFFVDLSAPRDAPEWAANTEARPDALWQAAIDHELVQRDKIPNAQRGFAVYRANVAALARYRPSASPVGVHWLRAADIERQTPDHVAAARRAWSAASRNLAESVVDAGHYSIVRAPAVFDVVRAILAARAELLR